MRLLLLFILLFSANSLRCQPLSDSVLKAYNESKTPSEKDMVLSRDMNARQGLNIEKKDILFDMLSYFKLKKDPIGTDYTLYMISSTYQNLQDYSSAMKYALTVLPRFEERKDTFGIVRSYTVIASSLMDSKNVEQSLIYWRKVLPIAQVYTAPAVRCLILSSISECFNKMNQPDSALYYAQEAVKIANTVKTNRLLSMSIGSLGEVYLARGEHDIARPFLKRSLIYGKLSDSRFEVASGSNKLSESFFATKDYDSSIIYAHIGLGYAYPDAKSQMMEAYELLYKDYEQKDQQDSVNKYFRLAMSTKDSLFTIEKNRNIQVLSFSEQVRQKEKEEDLKQQEKESRNNLQILGVAVGLIFFIILFLLLSRSVIVKAKFIKFFGVLGLLAVFEFINLFIHPYVGHITGHSPALMLIILIAIGGMLVPLHNNLEKWMINRMVEKNKKIRLSAAKKTIEKLEGKRSNRAD